MLATNSTSVLNATSAITPLSFLHVDPTRRRRRLQAAHKRRLNLAGLELEGNLNTLGCDIRYKLAHLLPNRPHASTFADESIACPVLLAATFRLKCASEVRPQARVEARR